jgi:hypothetical protein
LDFDLTSQHAPHVAATLFLEALMGKEQRNEKMSKKPKKDTSAPKGPVTSDRPSAPVTSVMPKGKEKYKQ